MPLNRFLRPPGSAWMLPNPDDPIRPQQYELEYTPKLKVFQAGTMNVIQQDYDAWVAAQAAAATDNNKFYIRHVELTSSGVNPNWVFAMAVLYEDWIAE